MNTRTTRRVPIVAAGFLASLAVAAEGMALPGSGSPAKATEPRCAQKLATQLAGEFPLVFSASVRPDGADHAQGRAVDALVDPAHTELGDLVVQRAHGLAGRYGVVYTAWHRTYWQVGQGPIPMEDRGSPTANNEDHVHISVARPYC